MDWKKLAGKVTEKVTEKVKEFDPKETAQDLSQRTKKTIEATESTVQQLKESGVGVVEAVTTTASGVKRVVREEEPVEKGSVFDKARRAVTVAQRVTGVVGDGTSSVKENTAKVGGAFSGISSALTTDQVTEKGVWNEYVASTTVLETDDEITLNDKTLRFKSLLSNLAYGKLGREESNHIVGKNLFKAVVNMVVDGKAPIGPYDDETRELATECLYRVVQTKQDWLTKEQFNGLRDVFDRTSEERVKEHNALARTFFHVSKTRIDLMSESFASQMATAAVANPEGKDAVMLNLTAVNAAQAKGLLPKNIPTDYTPKRGNVQSGKDASNQEVFGLGLGGNQ